MITELAVLGAALFVAIFLGRKVSRFVGIILTFGVLGPFTFYVVGNAGEVILNGDATLSTVLRGCADGIRAFIDDHEKVLQVCVVPPVLSGLLYYLLRRRVAGVRSRVSSIVSVAMFGAVANVAWIVFVMVGDTAALADIYIWQPFAPGGACAALVSCIVADLFIPASAAQVSQHTVSGSAPAAC